MSKGSGVFLGNPKDSVWEDWGTEQGRLGNPPPLGPLGVTPMTAKGGLRDVGGGWVAGEIAGARIGWFSSNARWWQLKYFFIFIPTWGNDPV